MEIRNFTPRLYQETILNTASNKNTLVVLPTGTGKTKIAILLAINRLTKFPESKILICSPTKPLSSQISKEFKECTNLQENEIILLTGETSPEKRIDLWKNSKIIVATPQTIESDLKNNRISLENFSLLVIDEAHRSREKFANTIVAKIYVEQAKLPRILALTASPGGTREKIQDIQNNLFIEAVEIRSTQDEDVKEYIQEKDISWVEVHLPEEFKNIKHLIKGVYSSILPEVRKYGIHKPLGIINKKDLLMLQVSLAKSALRKNPASYYGLSVVAQLIKLNYALDLIETQSLNSLKEYWDKLSKEESKAAKRILGDANIAKAINLTKIDLKHPKLIKLSELVSKQISENPSSKIIIFANYRNMVREILESLKNIPGINPVFLMGKKEGITQKQQIETINEFSKGTYNVLIGTSITEEGISIEGGADLAIFYDNVASAIRRIQRVGRVGRTKSGKIIFLITKGTIDEAYYWSSKKRENVMKKTLYKMKEENNLYDFQE